MFERFTYRRSRSRGRVAAGLIGAVIAMLLAGGCGGGGEHGRGMELMRAGQYDEAVIALRNAVDEHPDNRAYRVNLAEAEERSADSHFARAEQLEAERRLSDARDEIEIVLDRMPAYPGAIARRQSLDEQIERAGEQLILARTALDKGDHAEASRRLDLASGIDASHPGLYELRDRIASQTLFIHTDELVEAGLHERAWLDGVQNLARSTSADRRKQAETVCQRAEEALRRGLWSQLHVIPGPAAGNEAMDVNLAVAQLIHAELTRRAPVPPGPFDRLKLTSAAASIGLTREEVSSRRKLDEMSGRLGGAKQILLVQVVSDSGPGSASGTGARVVLAVYLRLVDVDTRAVVWGEDLVPATPARVESLEQALRDQVGLMLDQRAEMYREIGRHTGGEAAEVNAVRYLFSCVQPGREGAIDQSVETLVARAPADVDRARMKKLMIERSGAPYQSFPPSPPAVAREEPQSGDTPQRVFIGTVSRGDRRYKKEIETVDGIIVKVKDTDRRPLDADLKITVGRIERYYDDRRVGDRIRGRGLSGNRYVLVILDIDDGKETVHFAIDRLEGSYR